MKRKRRRLDGQVEKGISLNATGKSKYLPTQGWFLFLLFIYIFNITFVSLKTLLYLTIIILLYTIIIIHAKVC